ncbi:MAG: DUF11 domain-containing protein [Methanosarcinales archaeon]|nr:MAG: DUF11 domain-containing protein [Methanosarcinales archaeon]
MPDILPATVISTMMLLALLAVFTASASAYCNNGSADVLVTNPGGTGGGAYPETVTPQSEVWLTPYTGLNRATLDNYDTFVMWRVCETHLNTWTDQQKQDIVDWVYAGGKLIIWDTECTDNPDYTWLPYSFVTSNPGAMGSHKCPLTVVEENNLSSSDSTSPYYIDTTTICTHTDAVGDANILTTYSSSWCQDMEAINYYDVTGPVHVYAHYGSGLMIYCGLDADYMGLGYTGSAELEQVLLNELAQPWGDEACGLPCGAPIPPGVLKVDKIGDKTTMNVGETVTFTITVKNNGTSPITGITLQDILPPELSTTDPTTWPIGTLNPGAAATRTLTATAVASGSAQNVAKAMGTDASGNSVGSDDTFTVTIAANQPPVADAGPDQTIEQSYYQGADVPLDGSGSYDLDGDPITYSWTWVGGSAIGVGPTVSLPLGTTTVTLVVNDGTVDSSPDTVVITVQDTTPPVITCPADVMVEQETADGTVVQLTATATDICDANPTITSDELAIYPLGTTVITFTATDDSGNSATCTTTVTVIDTTPPEMTLSGEQMVLWPPNHKYRTIEIAECCVISVTDICDAGVDIDDVVITSVSSDEPENVQGEGDGNTVDDIVIVDSQTVELRAERQGDGNGRVYTVNFEVTDDSGNTETGLCTVWVPHDQDSGATAIDDGASAGYTVYS